MIDKVQYWLDLCDEDLSVAEVLLKSKKFLHMAFFCHLIAEKALKAVVAHNTSDTVPKIHKLKKLAALGNITNDLSAEQLKFLDRLMPFHVDGRYPENKQAIAITLNAKNCKGIFEETEEFLCWIKQKLGK
ncbi:MAG: HEPN domain-containing protein [Oscillospiraceae bacterium]|nr:HEPN domain-containing protein [Oscillospiraceae bacterium]